MTKKVLLRVHRKRPRLDPNGLEIEEYKTVTIDDSEIEDGDFLSVAGYYGKALERIMNEAQPNQRRTTLLP